MCSQTPECRKPEGLRGRPEDCLAEQIRECHGEVKEHPCASSTGCQNPEGLEGEPGDCSPQQVRRCHGDVQTHPCTGEAEE